MSGTASRGRPTTWSAQLGAEVADHGGLESNETDPSVT
jgi:hypothetical protein